MNHHFDQQGRQVGWLLTELEKQTAGCLSDESRNELLNEVACHLDAAIQARLELGMTPVEAEREAVEEFGHPRSYIDDLLKVHSRENTSRIGLFRGDRRTMLTFWAMTVFAAICSLTAYEHIVPLLLVGLALFAPFFATFSFRARRIQAVPVFVATLAAGLALTVGFALTWDNYYAHGGVGVWPKWKGSPQIADNQRILAQLEPLILPLQHRSELHAGIRAPYGRVVVSGDTILVLNNQILRGTSGVEDATAQFLSGDPDTGFQTPMSHWMNMDQFHELLEVPVIHNIPRNMSDPANVANWRPQPDTKIDFATCLSPDDANRAWYAEGQPLYEGLLARKERLESQITWIKRAQAAPSFSDLIADCQQTFPCIPIWFGVWATINFIFGGLGWFLALPASVRRRELA